MPLTSRCNQVEQVCILFPPQRAIWPCPECRAMMRYILEGEQKDSCLEFSISCSSAFFLFFLHNPRLFPSTSYHVHRWFYLAAGCFGHGCPADSDISIFTLRRRATLEETGITHIVSVLRFNFKETEDWEKYQHCSVEVDDVEDENLLGEFARTNDFIGTALKGGGKVLIHW